MPPGEQHCGEVAADSPDVTGRSGHKNRAAMSGVHSHIIHLAVAFRRIGKCSECRGTGDESNVSTLAGRRGHARVCQGLPQAEGEGPAPTAASRPPHPSTEGCERRRGCSGDPRRITSAEDTPVPLLIETAWVVLDIPGTWHVPLGTPVRRIRCLSL